MMTVAESSADDQEAKAYKAAVRRRHRARAHDIVCQPGVPAQNSISCEILGRGEFGVMKCTN
jgi:hypothetical protein